MAPSPQDLARQELARREIARREQATAAENAPPNLLTPQRTAQAFLDKSLTPEQAFSNTLNELTTRHGANNVRLIESDNDMAVHVFDERGNMVPRESIMSVNQSLGQIQNIGFQELKGAAEAQPEVDAWTNFLAGLKATEAGKVNFLKAKYERLGGQVIPESDENHNLTGNAIIKMPGKPPQIVKLEGMSVGTVAGASGDVGEALIGTGGAALGGVLSGGLGAALGGAGADALASAARQGISAALPGDDELTPWARVGKGTANVALGLAGEGTGKLLGMAGRGALGAIREGAAVFRRAGPVRR